MEYKELTVYKLDCSKLRDENNETILKLHPDFIEKRPPLK
jgi:hypothetical protein